jgi:hypothetical protein
LAQMWRSNHTSRTSSHIHRRRGEEREKTNNLNLVPVLGNSSTCACIRRWEVLLLLAILYSFDYAKDPLIAVAQSVRKGQLDDVLLVISLLLPPLYAYPLNDSSFPFSPVSVQEVSHTHACMHVSQDMKGFEWH